MRSFVQREMASSPWPTSGAIATRDWRSNPRSEFVDWLQDHVGVAANSDRLQKSDLGDIALVLPRSPSMGKGIWTPSTVAAKAQCGPAHTQSAQQAAHYIGLNVVLKLNEQLPVEHRLGEELKLILNQPCNLRLVQTETS